jgi:hypothetical protein
MAYTPYFPAIAVGSLAWGVPLNTALANLDRVQESKATDQGLINWNFSPGTNLVSTAITSGTVSMAKVWIRQPVTVNSVAVGIGTVGAALVAGQNFAGLYDSGGNRLGQTADQTAAWGTIGGKNMALTAPVVITTPGAYYVAILSNAGTTPAFARGSALTPSVANINLTATDGAWTTGPAGQTTLPVSITMAARSLTGNALWVAVG